MYGQNSWRKAEVRLKYVLQKFRNKRDKSLWDWEIENLKKENRNMKKLLALLMAGAKEVHIRIACPPLIYSCPFVGFTASKGDLELITRRVIKELDLDDFLALSDNRYRPKC